MTDQLPIVVRPARLGDLPFVLNSWLKSYHESEVAQHIPNDVYFADAGHHGICRALINGMPPVVACDTGNAEAMYGWACAAPGVLHYVYVKTAFRRLGIARMLLQAAGVGAAADTVATHFTRAIKAWRERGHRYVFNPYALMGANER